MERIGSGDQTSTDPVKDPMISPYWNRPTDNVGWLTKNPAVSSIPFLPGTVAQLPR